MFLLKKIVSPLFLPLSLSILALLLGWIYLQFRRRMRVGKFFIVLGIVLLIGFSLEFTSSKLLGSLENRCPPLNAERMADVKHEIKWIAVLSGGYNPNPQISPTGQLSNASLARLVEGIRLHRSLPGTRLILSGGAVFTPAPESEVMAKAARTFDIKSDQIVLESASRDTEEQALLIRKIVGKDRFILVTTASHMPRAMGLFRKAGMEPLPAPAEFRTGGKEDLNPAFFYPRAGSLLNSEIVVHEYLGILWSRLRGKI